MDLMPSFSPAENPPARWYYLNRDHHLDGPETLESLQFLLLKGEITFETPVIPESARLLWKPCRAVFVGEEG